jgi:hypothetical protein
MHKLALNAKHPEWSKIGYITANAMVVLTALTFFIAVLTPPLSGPWCESNCYEYPYVNIAPRFPRDYYWMYPAMLQDLLFVLLMACINQFAAPEKRIYSQIALVFGALSTITLFSNYFIQLSVVQPSLLNSETDGIAILTQFNPHGIFIALEEIGYLMMSIAFFCTIPVFSNSNRIEKAIRIIHFISFALTLLALIAVSIQYGIQREYRFEITVITINWSTLIISGILLSRLFHRHYLPSL